MQFQLGVEQIGSIKKICGNGRIGLITNSQTLNSGLIGSFEMLKRGQNIIKILSPEHGYYGNYQSGEYVPSYFDRNLGVDVVSLYRGEGKEKADSDAQMRWNDTLDAGKSIESGTITDLDTLIFDIQDIGTRIYTFNATMLYAMRAASHLDKEFVVLDRPNPINGLHMEGPILDYPTFTSFVGVSPVPVRHGMTSGELANFFNEKLLNGSCGLHVVKMKGWKRNTWMDQIPTPWVSPSPNIPTLSTATAYPGAVMLEGTNLSEGRGTTNPFLVLGAPSLDGAQLSKAINDEMGDNARAFTRKFRPTFSKFKGQTCTGIEIIVTNRENFRSFAYYLKILGYLQDFWDQLHIFSDYFDRVCGTDKVRRCVQNGGNIDDFLVSLEQDLESFSVEREQFLLYDEIVQR